MSVSTDDVVIRRVGAPGDLGWVMQAHGEQYSREFGWDASFEALVGRIVVDWFDRADEVRERGWIAEVDGQRVGCIFCMATENLHVAKLRILLVTPRGRRRGIGRRLVQECLDFARSAGYRSISLWTNDPLRAARSIYLRAGFVLDDEQSHRSFGVDLIGQNYSLQLSAPTRA